jgi:hypothetical protein
MVRSHLAALVLEGVHSLCPPSVTVFAEFQQSFAREAAVSPGIPRNALNAGGISTTRPVLVPWFFHRFSIVFKERLEQLVEGIPFEVLNSPTT